MKTFIKNYSALLFTLVAVLIALGAWFYPFRSEKISLSLASSENVALSPDPEITKAGSLEFLYNDEKVPNLISTKFRIKNSGNEPLQEKDFLNGFNIVFPEDSKIISYQLTQIQPHGKYNLFQQNFLNKKSDFELSFNPSLLNAGDIFDIDVLTTRSKQFEDRVGYFPEEIKYDYQIIGISQINEVSNIETNFEKQTEAKQEFSKIMKVVGVFAAMFLLNFISSKLFPKREKRIEEPRKKSDPFYFNLVFFSIIALGVLVYGLRIAYFAWFLST